MNKNWLYRVLALALVAMLALPMFALAEEAGQAEAVIEEQDSALIGDSADASDIILDRDPVEDGLYDPEVSEDLLPYVICNAYAGGTQARTIYLGGTANVQKYFEECLGITTDVEFPGKVQIYDKNFATITSFKSSKKAVATVNSEGIILGTGAGTATITIKGKALDGSKKTCKVDVTVVDPFEAKSIIDALYYTKVLGVKFHLPSEGFSVLPGQFITANQPNEDAAEKMGWALAEYTNKTTMDVFAEPEEGEITGLAEEDKFGIWPAIFNADGIDVTEFYNRGVTFTTSSSKVLPRAVTEDKLVGFYAFKPGKAKITVRAAGLAGKKSASVTVPVEVRTNNLDLGAPGDRAKALAAANNMLVYGIQSIKIKDANTVEVTLFFINPTNVTIGSLNNFGFNIYGTGMATDGTLQDEPFVSYFTASLNKKLKAATKKGPTVTTVKVTAKGAQVGDVLQNFGSLAYRCAINDDIHFDRMGALTDIDGHVAELYEYSALDLNQIWGND